jgi:hypothetical protein
VLRYPTRLHALVPPETFELGADALSVARDGGPSVAVPLSALRELRLRYSPTRAELNRFECHLRTRDGVHYVLTNRTYRGPLRFEDTSAAYVEFVRALVAATQHAAPQCRFLAGAAWPAFLLNLGCTLFTLGMLGVAVLLLASIGGSALVYLKLALILFFLPFALRWVKRNRPRPFDPAALPAELLPKTT